jgi:hypothetical protein
MGVDVELKVRTFEPLTDDELAEVDAAFIEQFGLEFEDDDHRISRDKYEGDGCIIDSLDRYYGPGYERGQWPRIRAMGDWLAVRFGETAEVRYGGDSAYEWDHLTPWPEARAECEASWRQVGHHPYGSWHRPRCDCDHCSTIPWPPNESGVR